MLSILLSCSLLFSSPSPLLEINTLKNSGEVGGGGKRRGEEPSSTKLPSLSGFCFSSCLFSLLRFFRGCHVLCIRFFCLIVCLLSETVQHESQVGKARRRKVWNIDILLTMLSLDMRLKKTHFSQAHWGLSSLQDQSLGSRESHPRDTLTAGEDLQTKVSTNVDLLSILWQNISWQSRTEEQLPVYQPPKKEEVVYSWEDFYPNNPVEVNFVLR